MEATQARLDELREQHQELQLAAEIATLERIISQADVESRRLVESEWGDIVDRREYLYDTPGWGYGGRDSRISRPQDRARGKCYPFFENELDLANIRGIGRFLATSTEVGAGILENLTNYTIGNGFTYEVQPIEKDQSAGLVATVQSYVDEFGKQLAERESFGRSRRDGDWFAWIHEFRGEPVVDVIEPEFVTEPNNARSVEEYCGEYGLDWSFGVASIPNRPARVIGYFVQWYGSPSDWEYVPAHEMIHVKVNVDSGVKRGIGDFFPTYITLERALKLAGNALQGGAIQAAIAYIREHVAGTTKDGIQSFANAKADLVTTVPRQGGGTKQVRQEKFNPGRVIDTVGTKYHAGPMGQNNGPAFEKLVQMGFRMSGARWAMPEYMISGDASNGNYASILTAGGPFDRATQARQGFYKTAYEEAQWKALGIRCRLGHFRRFGINTLAELKERIKLNVTAPTVAVQDPDKEESIRERRKKAGVLSPRTWASQVNLDYDAEVANGAKPDAPAPNLSLATSQQMESTLLECGGKGSGKPGPCPSATERFAVKDYTSDKFQKVNGALRNGEQLKGDIGSTVEAVDSYLAKSPTYKGRVYRKFQADASLMAQLQPGAVFTDKAFMSTSKDKPRFIAPGTVALEIIGTTGVDIQDASHHGAAEKEVLFPRNSKFKVVKVKKHEHGGMVALLQQLESVQAAEAHFEPDAGGDRLVEVENGGWFGGLAESARQAAVTAALESVRTTAEAKAILNEAYP